MDFLTFPDLPVLLDRLVHVALAFALAFPVGWNREHSSTDSAGIRTFPLVSVAACAFVLTGNTLFDHPDAQARVIYGVMTGIGFIGGGAIIKGNNGVAGTATAASIWNTGAIGVTVAYDLWDVALMLSVINFLVLQFGHRPESAG